MVLNLLFFRSTLMKEGSGPKSVTFSPKSVTFWS